MRILIAILIALAVGCKEKEPTPLDEGYPVTSSRERINLYATQKFGGTFGVKFNNHEWNHHPYLTLDIYKEFREGFGNDSTLYISFTMYSKLSFEPCKREQMAFYVPLKKGIHDLQKVTTPFVDKYFLIYECDYARGMKMREVEKSWVEIEDYDPQKSTIKGKFHVYYQDVPQKEVEYPIYPNLVEIEGTFSRDYFGKAKL